MNEKEAAKLAKVFCEVALYQCIEEGLITSKDIEKAAKAAGK